MTPLEYSLGVIIVACIIDSSQYSIFSAAGASTGLSTTIKPSLFLSLQLYETVGAVIIA